MSARKLPVLETAIRGWWLLAKDWSVLLRIVWLPLAVLVALDFLLAETWTKRLENVPYTSLTEASEETYLHLMDMALALALGGFIVALWHRVRLTGPRVLSVFGLLSAWRNIVALTVHWCSLILVTIGLTWVIGSLLGQSVSQSLSELLIKKYELISHPVVYRVLMDLILKGGPLLIALYISGRLGLVLWARPAGGAGALDRAWAAGDGNGWRIAASIFLAILPVMILESALQPGPVGGSSVFYLHLWFDLANLSFLIVAAGVISAAHRALLGGEDAGGATVSMRGTEGQSTA